MNVCGYVRVSRVAGREGESFTSPRDQRAAITRLAEAKGLTVVRWFEELDESGGNAARPEWLKTRDMIASGVAKGVVVLNFSRWARDSELGPASVKAIRAAGGEIWSVQEDFDTTSPEGWYMLVSFFAMAELFRNQAIRQSARVRASAIERGVYVARRVPFGYRRDPGTRRLVPDSAAAPLVVEAFERRARGQSWVSLGQWLGERGGPYSRTGARDLIHNVAYLGWARSGEYVNRSAHEPLVTEKLFDEASRKGTAPRHDGSISSRTLLSPTCGVCGHRMQANRSNGRVLPGGGRAKVIAYSCLNRRCEARAYVRQEDLDAWVVGNLFLLLERVGSVGYRIPGREPGDHAEALRALEAAEYAREKFLRNKEQRLYLEEDEYNRLLRELTEDVREARIAVEAAEAPELPKAEHVKTLWREWTTETRREWLRGMVEAVTVEPSRGRRGVSLVERVHVVYVGGWEVGAASAGDRPGDDEIKATFAALGLH